ncbi:adenylyltransferase/cytidyltransferase family protein [Patescibacteria group bacterium]
MRKIMVFGTFDIFHEGHRDFLRQASKFGDCLVVVIARDETVKNVKREDPSNNENDRLEIVKESGLVAKAVLGGLNDKYDIIREIDPDVICLGYDQSFFVDKLQDKLESFGMNNVKIVRLISYHPEKYKSSRLRLLKSKSKL